MFTIPHNTTVYLLKDPIDMRYGMYRLQGVIAQMLRDDNRHLQGKLEELEEENARLRRSLFG